MGPRTAWGEGVNNADRESAERHALSAARNFSNAASALGKLGKLFDDEEKLVIMNERQHALNQAQHWRRVARALKEAA